MNRKDVLVSGVLAGVIAALYPHLSGCLPSVFHNLTKEKTGNISMVFINNTPFTAAFSFGTYDAWDRPVGAATLEQLRLGPNESSAPVSVPCRRNVAVGTQEFYDRVIFTKADETADFDPEAFDTVVRFSRAPGDSTVVALPTEGSARGIVKLLGVDYSCEDQLVVKFFQDPDAPGGFRIDFEDILDKPLGE